MAYGNPHPKTAQLDAYRRKNAVKKARRLLSSITLSPSKRRKILYKDEFQMDINDIEAYIEHTLAIETEDIKDRTTAIGPALKLIELKKKLAVDTPEGTNQDDSTITLILQQARAAHQERAP